MNALKEEVHRIADELPDDATWDDVIEAAYLQKVVAEGLKAGAEGRQNTIQEVKKHFGLSA